VDNNIILKHEVRLNAVPGGKEASLDTPTDIDFTKVKHVTISHTADKATRISTYPNGLVIYMETGLGYAYVRTNWEIKEIENGKYTVVKP